MGTTRDDVNAPLLALIGFLSAIVVFAIIVLLTVIYYAAEARQEYAKNISQPYTEVENLLSSQQAKLIEYRWVDRENDVVAIPIDRAMKLVVAEERSDRRSAPSSHGTGDTAGAGTALTTGTNDSAGAEASSSSGASAWRSTEGGNQNASTAGGGHD